MRTIVVTGGIGAGKSLACSILETSGIPVYDCDSRAKALYETHPHLKQLLVPDIFNHPRKLAALEDALFPVLMQDFIQWAEGHRLVAFESATVLGKRYFDGFGDYVLYVDAPLAVRLERVRRRGGISAESALQRAGLQKEEKDNPRVTLVVDNSSDREHLEKQINDFLKSI